MKMDFFKNTNLKHFYIFSYFNENIRLDSNLRMFLFALILISFITVLESFVNTLS